MNKQFLIFVNRFLLELTFVDTQKNSRLFQQRCRVLQSSLLKYGHSELSQHHDVSVNCQFCGYCESYCSTAATVAVTAALPLLSQLLQHCRYCRSYCSTAATVTVTAALPLLSQLLQHCRYCHSYCSTTATVRVTEGRTE